MVICREREQAVEWGRASVGNGVTLLGRWLGLPLSRGVTVDTSRARVRLLKYQRHTLLPAVEDGKC